MAEAGERSSSGSVERPRLGDSGIRVISMPRKARATGECYGWYSPAYARRPRGASLTCNLT
ncbi:hypothetical protein E2C01_090768 [Portunus trituberculatus]|uniref:Uncharacterized protein n=1 Tax=Portunus trituberculatus TaxID=210409 RepID=A0A5B7JC64_PORTR|nr:hypothetical protein [Portunus trituberculatus]